MNEDIEDMSKYFKIHYLLPSVDNLAYNYYTEFIEQLGYDPRYPWCQLVSKTNKNEMSYFGGDAYYPNAGDTIYVSEYNSLYIGSSCLYDINNEDLLKGTGLFNTHISYFIPRYGTYKGGTFIHKYEDYI